MNPSGFGAFLSRPPAGWAGIVVVQSLSLAATLAGTVVAIASGTSPWLAVLGGVVVVLLLIGLYLLQRRAEPRVMVPENEQPERSPGLIVLVGTGRADRPPMEQSAGPAIAYHLGDGAQPVLKTCWLIASDGSLPFAQEYQKICREKNVAAHVRTVHDEFGVQNTFDVVRRIYAEEVPRAQLTEEQVIADFTGGTKPMSAGMILACGERRAMQYMTGGKAPMASVPRRIQFRPHR